MPLSAILWVGGLALLALGVWKVRQPLGRARALEATQANLKRYDDWRGGRRADGPERTGADEMRDLLRGRIRLWAGVAVAGVVCVVLGFVVR